MLAKSLRLEAPKDQERLEATIARYRRRLLVLDPLIRLTSIDENSSMEVSAVLGYLRGLQRSHGVAILVVHHARKSGAGGASRGLTLRGSGDFWAWSDSNLYLGRRHDAIELAVEHRSAAAPEPIALDLCSDDDDGPYLRTRNAPATEMAGGRPPLADRILHALRTTAVPRKLDDLRAEVRCRMQSLVDALRELATDGSVRRLDGGWQIAERADAENPGETEMGSVEAQPVEG